MIATAELLGSGKVLERSQLAVDGEGPWAVVDEDGIVVLLNDNPPAELHEDVRQAAAVCPALAITVEES